MNNHYGLDSLIKKPIHALYIRVFPPQGEVNVADMDVSIVFSFFDGREAFLVSTSREDGWTPEVVGFVPGPHRSWRDLDGWMKSWMDSDGFDEMQYELFDVSDHPNFLSMVGDVISRIEIILADEAQDAFGVKMTIGDDFIISFSNTDGNMITTSKFNFGRGLENFNHFGDFRFVVI